jgi:hypothetical protein
MFKNRFNFFLGAALLLASAAGIVYAGGGMKQLFLNGVVVSNRIRMMDGVPYAPLPDVARALNLRLSAVSTGYALTGRNSGTAAPVKSASKIKVPLTNLPAKLNTQDSHTVAVVNNVKANLNESSHSLWLPLSSPRVKQVMSDSYSNPYWTPPMTINGQTYGSGYFIQAYNGGPGILTFWLDHRGFTKLHALLGLDDHVQGDNAAVWTVTFLGNGRALKTVQVDASDSPMKVSVPLSGVNTLKIQASVDGQCSCFPGLDIVNPVLQKQTK